MRATTERIERGRKSPRLSPVIIDDEPCRFRRRRYRLWLSKYPQWQRRPAPPDGESGSPATPTVYQRPEDPFRFGHNRRATAWRGGAAYKYCTTRYSHDYKPGWRNSSLRNYLGSSRFASTERYQDWWRSARTPRSATCRTRRLPLCTRRGGACARRGGGRIS